MAYKFNGKLFTDFNDYKIALKESSDRFNSYAPWSNEEDEALLNGFDKGLSIKQLSDLHKRRGGGIRSRLKKLRPEDFSFENKNTPQEVFKENILLQVVEDLQTLHRKELSREENIPTNFTSYLRSLKPELDEFSSAIRNPKGDVRMPYIDQNTQIIYCLKYLHAYWHQIYDSLNFIKKDLLVENVREDLKIALFCAGPAPEIIGITKFLEENFGDYNSVDIHLYDQINEWDFARKNFIFSNGKKRLMEKHLNINFHFHEIDLTNQFDLDRFNLSDFYDVISFQNCLGEFSQSSRDDSSKNFLKVLRSLKPKSNAIFSERRIRGTEQNIKRIRDYASTKKYQIIKDYSKNKVVIKADNIPEIICNGNFFVDPDHSSPGESVMQRNKFQTLILLKPKKKIIPEQKNIQNKETRLQRQLQKVKPHPYLTRRQPTRPAQQQSSTTDNSRNAFSNFKMGDEIMHSSFGKGKIKSTIKSVTDNIIALVIEFEEYTQTKTVNFPCEEIKKVQNTY